MHIEFLVEEESMEVALYNLVPMIIGEDISFRVHSFQGKKDLLNKLSLRLNGYRRWIPDEWRIVVLIDEDREDCHDLKATLEEEASDSGFITKSMANPNENFQVLNRIVIEELEAWFFGDAEALRQAYPRLPRSLEKKQKYRMPDSILGGTWETLNRLFKIKGYFREGMPKIEVARTVSAVMDPDRNRSKSFQVFRDGLRAMVA
jgi:hypothetical protein